MKARLIFLLVQAALLASWPVIVLGWIGVPVFFASRAWFMHVQRAELRRLLELERQLKGVLGDEQ